MRRSSYPGHTLPPQPNLISRLKGQDCFANRQARLDGTGLPFVLKMLAGVRCSTTGAVPSKCISKPGTTITQFLFR